MMSLEMRRNKRRRETMMMMKKKKKKEKKKKRRMRRKRKMGRRKGKRRGKTKVKKRKEGTRMTKVAKPPPNSMLSPQTRSSQLGAMPKTLPVIDWRRGSSTSLRRKP